MGWLQDMENIGIIDIIKSKFDNYFDQILEFIEEQRKMHVHGISMKIISSLSIDNKSENQRGQLEEIMNQLQNDNFLASEDPFFDLEKLEIQRKLGNGQFGDVYLAKSKETSDIYAVKVSKNKIDEETKYSDQTLSMFREINLMSSFNHSAILKFIGYSPTNFEGQFYPTIIMEFCVNRTLENIIDMENKGLSPEGWDETKKLINIYGIAAGMKYLHQQGILHRDLKSQNILLDDLLCPKIADFGLSKMTTDSSNSSSMNLQSVNQMKGTPLYMAPEILAGDPYSKEADVYAFSIIVYEIVTGKTPFKGLNFPQLVMKVTEGERPELTDDIPEYYKILIEECWAQSPQDRPSFDIIVDVLKNNDSFLSDLIDESNYRDFIDFVDNYQSTFDLYKRHIIFDDFVKGKHGDTNLKKVYIEGNFRKVVES